MSFQSFVPAFSQMKNLRILFVTTVQHVTDEDAEEHFSDDASGDFSVLGEMVEYHALNEAQDDLAVAYFSSCFALELLFFLPYYKLEGWKCISRSDGSTKAIVSPCDHHEDSGIWGPSDLDRDCGEIPGHLHSEDKFLRWGDYDERSLNHEKLATEEAHTRVRMCSSALVSRH